MNIYFSQEYGQYMDEDQVVKWLVGAFEDESGATREDVDDQLSKFDLKHIGGKPLQQREKYLLVSQAMTKIWENEYKKASEEDKKASDDSDQYLKSLSIDALRILEKDLMRMEKTENNLLRLLDIQLEILRRGKGGKKEREYYRAIEREGYRAAEQGLQEYLEQEYQKYLEEKLKKEGKNDHEN